MSLLVVGSIALDSIETPHGRAEDALGGSAVYFSYAASFLAPVRLVGVVGEDFPEEHVALLRSRGIDLAGLQRLEGGTFRWQGRYMEDMNTRETVKLSLNVFGEFDPVVPNEYLDSGFIFLANGPPAVQRKVLDQVRPEAFVMVDTMNVWIETTRPQLEELLRRADALVLNDGEALQLSGESSLIRAGKAILAMGPGVVIIKKGEHGALMVTEDGLFVIPAYPTETVRDPTGAGDSFAGGVMGWLARENDTSTATLRRAMAYGTVLASFTVEDFSLNRLRGLDSAEIEARLAAFADVMRF